VCENAPRADGGGHSFNTEDTTMNSDRTQGAWKQMRGKMQQTWGEKYERESTRDVTR